MLLSPCFKAGKWFVPTTYVNDRNGESYPSFNATRDRLSLLAVGFTGSRALGFKVSNSMERTLRQTPVAIATKQKLSDSLVKKPASCSTSLRPTGTYRRLPVARYLGSLRTGQPWADDR